MDLEFLAQTDAATIRFELAKRQLEAAKAELDAAKQSYEEILNKADEHGFVKSKLKKLSDDRVLALFEAGIVQVEGGTGVAASPVAKPVRTKRPKKKTEEINADEEPLASDQAFQNSDEEPAAEIEPPSLDQ